MIHFGARRAACGRGPGSTMDPDLVDCSACHRTIAYKKALTYKGRRWWAGWNQPGQLPEQMPKDFDRWQDAYEFIRGEIHEAFLRDVDRDTLTVTDDQLIDMAPAAQVMATTPQERPFIFYYHGYHWWVADLPETLS